MQSGLLGNEEPDLLANKRVMTPFVGPELVALYLCQHRFTYLGDKSSQNRCQWFLNQVYAKYLVRESNPTLLKPLTNMN